MVPKLLSISSFKKNILVKAAFFILAIVIIAISFQYFFERKIILNSQSGSAYKINRILNFTDENEVPIFGASTAQGGFMPSVLGNNFFNYGIDGIKDDVLLFFLNQECKKKKKNKNILIVTGLEGFTYGLGDLDSYILNCNNPAVRELIGNNYKFYFNIPFIKYYGKYELYFKDYLNERMMLTKFKDKGASIEKNALTKSSFDDLVNERKNTVSYFKNDSMLEGRFISFFQQHPEKTFVLVVPPYHPSYFNQFKNYEEAVKFFFYLSSTFKNIFVLDYSHDFLPDDCYINTTHLNYKGALHLNNELKDTLQKIFNR